MKSVRLFFVMSLVVILGSCGMSSNFNRQKHTNLKKIKPTYDTETVVEVEEEEQGEVSPDQVEPEKEFVSNIITETVDIELINNNQPTEDHIKSCLSQGYQIVIKNEVGTYILEDASYNENQKALHGRLKLVPDTTQFETNHMILETDNIQRTFSGGVDIVLSSITDYQINNTKPISYEEKEVEYDENLQLVETEKKNQFQAEKKLVREESRKNRIAWTVIGFSFVIAVISIMVAIFSWSGAAIIVAAIAYVAVMIALMFATFRAARMKRAYRRMHKPEPSKEKGLRIFAWFLLTLLGFIWYAAPIWVTAIAIGSDARKERKNKK